MIWRHVVIGTHNSWLHGDERGFRTRRHRIHSSGDYKAPPPAGEHHDLHLHQQNQAGEAVELSVRARAKICREFIKKMKSIGFRVIAGAVSERHLHALVELPDAYAASIKIVGRCKQKASHAVRDELPGTIRAAGESLKRIRGAGHLRNSYKYIRTGQESGTIVWSHNPEEDWIHDTSKDVVIMIRKKYQGRISRTQAGV